MRPTAGAAIETSVTWPPDFGALTRGCERTLVEALALQPVALPEELARMTGVWQGAEVVATARAYAGPGIELARFATVEGDSLSIGNLLALPAAGTRTPILGADLVWIGTRPEVAMIACDLSPTLDGEGGGAAQNQTTAEALTGIPAVPLGGALPAWCAAIFSPSVLYTRYGRDDSGAATAALLGYVNAFARIAARRDGQGNASAVRSGIERYCRRHLEDDRGLLLLERLFDKQRAWRYVHEILFPTQIDGCVT